MMAMAVRVLRREMALVMITVQTVRAQMMMVAAPKPFGEAGETAARARDVLPARQWAGVPACCLGGSEPGGGETCVALR